MLSKYFCPITSIIISIYYYINCSFYVRPIEETKQDRLKKVDPILLFPIKAWLRGFLPGHKFTWEDEANFPDEVDVEKEVEITAAH